MTTIKSTCGKYTINLMEINRGESVLTIANQVGFDFETMSNESYWFTVGTYRTMKTAIRWAVKKMEEHNIQLAV